MLLLRNLPSVQEVQEPYMRQLLTQRFAQLAQDKTCTADIDGLFVVVEPGDTVAAIEATCEWPILHGLFDEVRYGEPDFVPCCEVLEEHLTCFELAYVTNDNGCCLVIWVPKVANVDSELLSFCQEYAS